MKEDTLPQVHFEKQVSLSGHMKGPVEKGRKWRFEVKIEIAPI